jgi:hypothetical protein
MTARPCLNPACLARVDAPDNLPRYCPACKAVAVQRRLARRHAAYKRRILARSPCPEPTAPTAPTLPPCPTCGGPRRRDWRVVYCVTNRCEAAQTEAPRRAA